MYETCGPHFIPISFSDCEMRLIGSGGEVVASPTFNR